MIKKLILAVALFASQTVFSQVINSNILLSVRIQWSTNHTDWNEAFSGSESAGYFVDRAGVPSSVFYSVLTNNNGIIAGFQKLDVDTRWGVSADCMTNHLLPVELLIKPTTTNNGFENIIYRPILSITNNTPPMPPCTNCADGDTNDVPPPNP